MKMGPTNGNKIKTRPDTRPSVADGWAGAEMQLSATKNVLKRSFPHFLTRVHGPTDGPRDGPTNGWTKPLIELREREKRIKREKKSLKSDIWSAV